MSINPFRSRVIRRRDVVLMAMIGGFLGGSLWTLAWLLVAR